MSDVTTILRRMQAGDAGAADDLIPLIYSQLHRMAVGKMSNERVDHTLQATALVNEAWLRLTKAGHSQPWQNREGFYASAAEAMRRILVDVARRRLAEKRGGESVRVTMAPDEFAARSPSSEVVAVNDALNCLQSDDATAAQLVKLHYFGGLSLEEAGALLDLSRATAYRTWEYARAFLRAELKSKYRF